MTVLHPLQLSCHFQTGQRKVSRSNDYLAKRILWTLMPTLSLLSGVAMAGGVGHSATGSIDGYDGAEHSHVEHSGVKHGGVESSHDAVIATNPTLQWLTVYHLDTQSTTHMTSTESISIGNLMSDDPLGTVRRSEIQLSSTPISDHIDMHRSPSLIERLTELLLPDNPPAIDDLSQ